jgi:hypothetical protein
MENLFGLKIPTALDEIVTLERDTVEIGLATGQEIASLAAVIDCAPGAEKEILLDWRLVAVRESGDLFITPLCDAARPRSTWGTSKIVGIDLGHDFLRTKNSIYRLGVQGDGELPVPHILTFCGLLHEWGAGETLGALPIFF